MFSKPMDRTRRWSGVGGAAKNRITAKVETSEGVSAKTRIMIMLIADAWRGIPVWLRLSIGIGSLVTAGLLSLIWVLAAPGYFGWSFSSALSFAFVLLVGAWTILLHRAVARSRKDLQSAEIERLALVERETQAVLDYLAEEFQKQFDYADRELSQTQELLRDAIDTLTISFSSIYGNLNAQQSLARTISQESGDPAECPEMEEAGCEEVAQNRSEDSPKIVDKVLEISCQLDIDINTAIRTLQFQDLTNQLIGHAVHRISAMNNALSDIKSVSLSEEGGSDGFIDYLCRHREAILRKVANLDERKPNPVSQGHMGTGDIDLF
jgi:hypothetical protein